MHRLQNTAPEKGLNDMEKENHFGELTAEEEEWIEAYLNGTIQPEAFQDMQDRMLACPAMRRTMRRYFNLDFHLHHGSREFDSAAPPWLEAEAERTKPTPSRSRIWAIAAAVAVLATGLSFLALHQRAEAKATITAIQGPVQWTSGDGQVHNDLEIGARLGGGVLGAMLPNSWVEFAFGDGSSVTVSGQTTLMLPAGSQRELHLRQGSLSASIVSQEPSTPMAVHTPTSRMEVLGTRFEVDADPASTRLLVNEGRVRMTRLVDGVTTEVAAGHQVVASIDYEDRLAAVPRGEAKRGWRSNLSKEVTYGQWSSKLEALAYKLKKAVAEGRITASAAMAKYKEAADLSKNHGHLKTRPKIVEPGRGALYLVILSLVKEHNAPLIAAPGARFRVRGGIELRSPVTFGFTARHPQGGFAGKYEYTQNLSDSQTGFDIDLPLASFQAVRNFTYPDPLGLEITDWWCFTAGHDAGLEINQVEFLTP